MFCFHKYGKIDNNYQYCEKCGKAKIIPCFHTWQLTKEINVFSWINSSLPEYFVHIYHCIKCGEVKKIRID